MTSKKLSPLKRFKQFTADTWQNLTTGMGVLGHDKTMGTSYKKEYNLTGTELDEIYEGEGMGSNIPDCYVRDMTRAGYTITNDREDYLKDSLKMLKHHHESVEALTWHYAKGGALFVYIIADGSDSLEEPLNENNIQAIEGIRVFERYEVSVKEWDRDVENSSAGTPTVYWVNSFNMGSFPVHHSRTFRFNGLLVPRRRMRANQGWGTSIIQKVYTQLRQYGSTMKNVESIVEDFIISILKIKDLADILQADDEDENLVQKRMQLLDLTKHIINTVLIDSEEDFDKRASSVAGLDKIIDKFILALSAVTGIPVVVLMGQSPAGLQATGDSDIRLWYDRVAYEQMNHYQPAIQKTINLLMMVNGSPFKGTIDNTVDIEFTALWQPTEKEKAETEKLRSEYAVNYNGMGGVTADEVREDLDKRDIYELNEKVSKIPIIEPNNNNNNEG